MHISLVIHSAWPLMGGLEKVCLRVGQGLRENGHSSRIIARATHRRTPLQRYFSEAEREHEFENDGVPTTVLGFGLFTKLLWLPLFKLIWRPTTLPWARQLHNLIIVPKLLRACRKSDGIHFFGNGPELIGFSAAATARRLRIPFVIEPALHEGQWGDSFVDKQLYRLADLVIAHSRHEKQLLEQLGVPTSRIFVVRHGVDICDNGNGSRFRSCHGITGPMVLFLGRKTSGKGVHRTLAAFGLLRDRLPSANLVIMGPRQGKESFACSDGVLDLDEASEQEKQDALAACDVLCVPSEGESFGMVYFEAWAYGKPVIALDLPPLRESIGECGGGLLTSPEPSDIAVALERLMVDPDLGVKLGANGKLRAQEHLWAKSLESYLESYANAGIRGTDADNRNRKSRISI